MRNFEHACRSPGCSLPDGAQHTQSASEAGERHPPLRFACAGSSGIEGARTRVLSDHARGNTCRDDGQNTGQPEAANGHGQLPDPLVVPKIYPGEGARDDVEAVFDVDAGELERCDRTHLAVYGADAAAFRRGLDTGGKVWDGHGKRVQVRLVR
eukprot:6203673-Pleurochrysis_carterae.AAC.1